MKRASSFSRLRRRWRKSSFNRLRARPADEPSPARGNAESGHSPKLRWRTHRALEATSWRSAPRRSWSMTGLRSARPRGETGERARRRDVPAVPPPQSGPARWSSSWGAIVVRARSPILTAAPRPREFTGTPPSFRLRSLLRRFLLTEKLDGDVVEYGRVVSGGRTVLLTKVIIE